MRRRRIPAVFFVSFALLVVQVALAAEPPWHFPQADARWLVRILASPQRSAPLARPVRVLLKPAIESGRPAKLSHFSAWDLSRDQAALAQVIDPQTGQGADGAEILLDPGQPITPGQERRFLVYGFAEDPGNIGGPAGKFSSNGRIEAQTYVAEIDKQAGGVVKSLQLKVSETGRPGGDKDSGNVEVLGQPLAWWIGRKDKITPQKFGPVEVKQVFSGPVALGLRIVYPDVLTKGNTFTVDYRFFRDFFEVDYRYRAATPVDLLWLKTPVTLAPGNTPGVSSGSQRPETPLLTIGDKSVYPNDRIWHDVSYFGPGVKQPFGLGVIAREAAGGLYFMDSVRGAEQEWIYAEPFGYKDPVRIDKDFAVRLAIVPHAAGEGKSVETAAKVEGGISATCSAAQARGAAPIDSDGDGLSDLDELAAGTNPNCVDTDGDGIADGQDADPLRGPAPARKLDLPAFTAAPTSRQQTIAAVKEVGDVPTLVIDGKPYGPMTYTRCAGTLDQIGQIADRGFPVHFEMVGNVGWPGQQDKTFKDLDAQIDRFLKSVPNAKLILRLYVWSPRYFARDYPDEVLKFSDGSTQPFSRWYIQENYPPAERGYPSFASETWRRGIAQALYNYVTHVRQSKYAGNVIGYFVCGGGTEEWYYWGHYDTQKLCPDFSAPMVKFFREHLRRTYGGDVTKLRAAWQDSSADFGSAMPPGVERKKATSGAFWEGGELNRYRDYLYVHNKAMEDSLLIFARAVKQACNREQLVGMFHGYLQNHWLLEGGQATLHEVLACPDIDFWSGPPQYDRRGPGEHGCIRFPIASLKAHGKLWISESDIRTNFSEYSPSNPALHGRPLSLEESLACLQREYAHQLCEGGNGWWFQMGKSWYHHEPILSLFEKMQTIGEAAMGVNRASDTDIAAVVDLRSLFTGPAFPVSSSLLDAFKVQETCRIGAPVDHYELADILREDAKRYKLYLMLNCFSLDGEQRKLIDQRLRRHGATLVWMYAPGLFNPGSQVERGLEHPGDLLGYSLKSQVGSLAPTMKLTEQGTAYASGFDPQRAFGSFERPRWEPDASAGGEIRRKIPGDTKLPELFSADEQALPGDAQVLARFIENGQPSIVMKNSAGATEIWIGSVMAPADFLRAIARRAGCHLYCDADEIIYANKSFVAIHTATDGRREFHLRRTADVVEVFTGEVLGRGVQKFQDSIEACRTRLYFVGDLSKWEGQMTRAQQVLSRFKQELAAARAAGETKN